MGDQLTAYVMVGVPGSGKSVRSSQLAKEHDAVIVSGDLLRDELESSGLFDPSWVAIWDKVEEEVAGAIEKGKRVILDGTHVGSAHRKEVVSLLWSYGLTNVEAIVMTTPLKDCIQRNASRQRRVPEYVITHMFETLQREIININDEGFRKVTFTGGGYNL